MRERTPGLKKIAIRGWANRGRPAGLTAGYRDLRPARGRRVPASARCRYRVSGPSRVQEVWLRLKDRPPFSIREHHELFVTINLYWANLPIRLGPGQTRGQHDVDLWSLDDEQPSRAYAAAVTEYFGAGVTEDT